MTDIQWCAQTAKIVLAFDGYVGRYTVVCCNRGDSEIVAATGEIGR